MDIVERLRIGTGDGLRAYDWMNEAADEIDLLRQYKSELEDAIASNNPTEIFNKSARLEGLLTALKEKE